jgi:uncharacterized protein (DUF433 family)
VRLESTGSEIVTWGEFVETRLLAEFRNVGVPMYRMRPAVERLRDELGTLYPLAYARPFTSGRELVLAAQEDVGLASPLRLIVIRSGQAMLTGPASRFVKHVEFEEDEGPAQRLRPISSLQAVVMDPLRQFGAPVVRSVPTEVIAEQIRAGDNIATIAELYDLAPSEVEAAIRFELIRADGDTRAGEPAA